MFRLGWKLHRDGDRDKRLIVTLCSYFSDSTGLRCDSQSLHCHRECRSQWSFDNDSYEHSGIHWYRRPYQQYFPRHRSQLHVVSDQHNARRLRVLDTILQRIHRQLHCHRNRNERITVSLRYCNLHRTRLRPCSYSNRRLCQRWNCRYLHDHNNCVTRFQRSSQSNYNSFSQHRSYVRSHSDEHFRHRHFLTLLHWKRGRVHSHGRRDE